MRIRYVAVLAVGLLFVGCEGPMGPAGPAGPAGEQGPQGEVGPGGTTRLTFQGQLNEVGGAIIELPSEAGTLSEPPVVSCYVSSEANGTYVLGSTDSVVCAIDGASAGLRVILLAPTLPRWYYRIAVVY